MVSKLSQFVLLTSLSLFTFLLTSASVDACTRVMYKGPDNIILTGRSMDFSMPIPANLWVMPRGMQRSGEVGPNSIHWTSKYGSLVVSSWDIASSDGMNEKGLVANMLWLVESEYAEFDPRGSTPGLSISLWAQFVLDNFATVAEAVAALSQERFVVVTDVIPGTNKMTTIHLSVSDATGDSAIFEYIDGKLVIHHDPSYIVMTNDPPYEQQLAIKDYWSGIAGNQFLPGTVKSPDRFARAHYYIQNIPQTSDPLVASASVMSVVRNVSVPYGYQIEGYPNLSSTQWRVVADQTNMRYIFETATTPNTFWVDLKELDFSESAPARVLRADRGQVYAGETSSQFTPAEPFKFQGLEFN
ncbi:MAG: choloylglycine hydrolase [Idiomarinaceae bacterium HL-53]|nr:MAG: choloylglycine hydrolase [Idiomarinaceae bacterium HL-53]CUS49197.1 choloylglycine hydrolase [Idiomarinaceae bacterium HL-53]